MNGDDLAREIIRHAAPTPDAPTEPATPAEEQPRPLDPAVVADRIWANR
jgi:hypothetical protein